MGKAWKYTGPEFGVRHLWWSSFRQSWVEVQKSPGHLYRPASSTDRSPPDEIIEVDNEAAMRRILAGEPEVDLSAGLCLVCSRDSDDMLVADVIESVLRIDSCPIYPSLEDTKRLRDYLSAYIEMKESE